MNPLKALKLLELGRKLESTAKENAPMSLKATQIVGLLVQIIGTLGLSVEATKWTSSHLMVVLVVNLVLTLGHALCPSVVPAPIAPNPDLTKKVGLWLLLALAFCGLTAHAQTTPVPLQNLYAGGVSYSVNATPSIAGTGLYAHLLPISPDTYGPNTYAFTAVDALPNTIKPFTVSTNIGAGIAQKIFTLGNVPVFVPTAAGISFNGSSTGWQWNGGGMASIHIKGNYYILPSVRFLKSSVSNGTGYQPIIGLLFGWGN